MSWTPGAEGADEMCDVWVKESGLELAGTMRIDCEYVSWDGEERARSLPSWRLEGKNCAMDCVRAIVCADVAV